MALSKQKFVIYQRVSTQKQGRSGLGLEAQQAAVEQYLSARNGVPTGAPFVEVETGKNNERPQLKAAIARCKATRSHLLIAKLDRLSRNAAFLLLLKEELERAGVKFVCADMPDMNTMMLGVMALVAQHEAEAISARTKAALAARKARGQPLGVHTHKVAGGIELNQQAAAQGRLASAKARSAKSIERAVNVQPMIAEAVAQGAKSLREIAAFLNEGGATTPRGKQWTAGAVRRAKHK